MFCKNCGKELEEGWAVCAHCGCEIIKKEDFTAEADREGKGAEEVSESADVSVNDSNGFSEKETGPIYCASREYYLVGVRRTQRRIFCRIPETIKEEGDLGKPDKWNFEKIPTTIKVEGENIHVITKREKVTESQFEKKDVASIDFPVLPVWRGMDFVVLAAAVLLMFLTFGLSISFGLWIVHLSVVRHLRIKLNTGRVIKIPICQKADASKFLKELNYSEAEIEKNDTAKISDDKWANNERIRNVLLALIAICLTVFGLELYNQSENGVGLFDSDRVSVDEANDALRDGQSKNSAASSKAGEEDYYAEEEYEEDIYNEEDFTDDSEEEEAVSGGYSLADLYTEMQDNDDMPYQMSAKSQVFLAEYENYFPATDDEQLEVYDMVDTSIEYRYIEKNPELYGDRLMLASGLYITSISETDLGEIGMFTWIEAVDEQSGECYDIFYNDSLDLFREDMISAVVLPLGFTFYENVGGGTTQSLVAVGSTIEKLY